MQETEEECVQLVSHVLPDLVEQSLACSRSDLSHNTDSSYVQLCSRGLSVRKPL